MSRALGVFVVLFALATPASAQKEAEKPAATKPDGKKATPPKPDAKKTAAKKADATKADAKGAAKDGEALDEAAPEGSDADAPLTPEEIEASLPPHVNGPKLVDLGSNIELDLPAGMLLLERDEARKMLEKSGDFTDNVLGIVAKLDANWMIVIEYDDIGYVSDKDADQLDANDLFKQFQDGNIQQNIKRKSLGVPELYLDGWSEMPQYKKTLHHLVWGLKGHSTDGPVINFFTRVLGRHGYMSVNLIDSPDAIEQSKMDTAGVLGGVRFKTGYTYEDYQEGDKNSGIGLKALVLGGAGIAAVKVAKGGFLVAILVALKKGFIVIIAAIAGLFKWIFGRKKKDDLDVGSMPPSDPPSSDPSPPSGPTV